MRRSLLTLLALCLASSVLPLVGCASDETAVDVHLTVDADIADEATLAGKLSSLDFVIDAPEGLYRVGSAPSSSDQLRLEDVDKDGWLEVLTSLTVAPGATRLPVIRIDRGSIEAESLELRIDGISVASGEELPAGERIAVGGIKEARFVSGEINPVQVPFNLRSAYRPPYVAAVYPRNGSKDVSALVGSVLLVFSKPMALSSLRKANVIQLVAVVGGGETPVPASRIELREQHLGGPTMAEYHLTEPLGAATLYRVRVSTEARDESGRALDQRAQERGLQGFQSQFSTLDAPTPPQPAMGMDQWCENDGEACAPFLRCDKAQKACVPDGCPESCAAGSVCDTSQGLCVEDCRPYGVGVRGSCAEARLCSEAGLCVSASGDAGP